MAQLNQNLGTTTTLDDFTPLPPGEYRVLIVKSEIKETRAGGMYLSFSYEVTEGDHAGRYVFDKVDIWHNSPKAAEFAKKKLKTIAVASGHGNPNFVADSSELHGREMFARLAIRKGDDGTEYQDVKGYRSTTADTSTPTGQPAASAPVAQNAAQVTPSEAAQAVPAAAKKPWE